MQSVAAIRKVCEENGVNLIVLTAPVYTDYYKNFYDEDITNFYESLAKVTDYWDFSSSSVSSEPRFFYDSTHFRNNIGEMMAAALREGVSRLYACYHRNSVGFRHLCNG